MFVAPADRVHLAGTATDLAAKRLISTLAAGLAGDDSGIRIDDGYIVYVVSFGQCSGIHRTAVMWQYTPPEYYPHFLT